jgi:hypothetical protein
VTSHAIVAAAAAIAGEWRWLAIVWHAIFAVLLTAVLVFRIRDRRAIAMAAALPFTSVAALAWWTGNPFNGAVFTVFALALLAIAAQLPASAITIGEPWAVSAGACSCVFAWTYPHFLSAGWTEYFYAAPLGLLPCPTLALCVGLSLITQSFGSLRWTIVVVTVALTYGVVGIFALGVTIDWALVAGAMLLGWSAWNGAHERDRRFLIHVRRTT